MTTFKKDIIKFFKTKSFIFSLGLIFLLALSDISFIRDNLNSDFNSLIFFSFGGIAFSNIRLMQVSKYIFITCVFLYLLVQYLGFSNERDYTLLLRYNNRKKYLISKLKKILIFDICFFLLISLLYIT
jgi:hypothetical protein